MEGTLTYLARNRSFSCTTMLVFAFYPVWCLVLISLSLPGRQLGFVAGFSNNNVHTRSFNAFYIGARAADATANLTLATVNSFLDAITEEKAAIALMNETQADCIGSMVNDNTVNYVTAAVRFLTTSKLSSPARVRQALIRRSPFFGRSGRFSASATRRTRDLRLESTLSHRIFSTGSHILSTGLITSIMVRAIQTSLGLIEDI